MALKKIIIFVFLFLFAVPVLAEKNNLNSYFIALREQTVWPVKDTDFDDIISAFGPRGFNGTTYDFHRGLDIGAAEGTRVKAITDGVLYDVVTWSGAGNTVILQHTFNTPTYYHGKELTYYYTLYMHLSSAKYTEDDVGKTIKAGKVIGYVGQTGNATTPHLHLQLMVGTWYDLETQLAYPNSRYSGFGFDPAVNSMLFFPPEKKNFSLDYNDQENQVTATFPDDQPLFNKVKLVIKNSTTKEIVKQHVLNYNYRTGFDATSEDALDTPDMSKLYIDPGSYCVDYIYTSIVIPEGYISKYSGSGYVRTLYVYDIWGRSEKIKI